MNRAVEAGNFIPQAIVQERGNGRPLTLMEHLDHLVAEDPERFPEESVVRVGQFVQYETGNPNKLRPYRNFVDLIDFQIYYLLHPQWLGKSIGEMQKDFISGASSFQQAFYKWALRVAQGDKKKAKELTEHIFPGHHHDWTSFTELEDWKREFSSHHDWQGRSQQQMEQNTKSDATAFHAAFSKWVLKEGKDDKTKKRKLRECLYKSKYSNWDSYTEIEDWVREYRAHSEWHGKSSQEMLKDTESGAGAFLNAFYKWLKKESEGDKGKRKVLVDQLFTRRRADYSTYATVEDWQYELQKHSDWVGRTTSHRGENYNREFHAFYVSFCAWVRREAKGDDQKMKALRAFLFSSKIKDRASLTTLEDWQQEFERHPEWHGKSPGQMSRDPIPGAKAFVAAFRAWVRNTFHTEEERIAYMRAIFTKYKPAFRRSKKREPIELIFIEEARAEFMKLVEDEDE